MVPASAAHAAAMATMHAACFPPEARWGADAMALQLGLPGAFGFIDARGGFVLARVAADEAEILTLAVLPAVRRGGVARALLRRAVAAAADAGAASLFLEVAEGNAAARALYAAEGFCPVGRRRRYYPGGGDALVLRRMIAPGLLTPAK
jgi:ribosomal-protein-alanine N-acetyltransferase